MTWEVKRCKMVKDVSGPSFVEISCAGLQAVPVEYIHDPIDFTSMTRALRAEGTELLLHLSTNITMRSGHHATMEPTGQEIPPVPPPDLPLFHQPTGDIPTSTYRPVS